MTKMILGYWNIRGLGQIPRLLAAYGGIELEQTRYTEWNKWHGQDKQNLGFDFPNLPYIIDGQFKLTESSAINQYIILQSGHKQLLGKTAKDRARIDNIMGVLKDSLKEIRGLFWNKDYANLKGAALQKARAKFDYLENAIGNKQWAIGYLTLADFEIAEASYYIAALYPEQYSNWSFWQTIRENFNNLPQIVNYYKREDALVQPFLPPQMAVLNPKFKETLILGYWGIRGLAQHIRLLLTYVGLPFEDKLYKSREEWFENGKNTLGLSFPNIPYLIDGEFKLTESSAIQRYVVNKSGHKELLGKNTQDAVRVQSILSIFQDIMTQFGKNFWNRDQAVVKETLQKISPKLDKLTAFVGERNTVLQYLTIADFVIAERSHYIQFLFPEQYKRWEFLQRIRDNIDNLQSIVAYYNSEKAIRGPFMPPIAYVNPSFQQYQKRPNGTA